MAQTLLTISTITRAALAVLQNQLVLANKVNRQYDSQFAKGGAKVGATVNVRKPPRFLVTDGPALQVQDATEGYVPVTIQYQKNVAMSFSSADLALHIDDFSDRFIKPAVASIANKIDYDLAGLYSGVYNMVGTPGTIPNDTEIVLAAGQRLNEEAAPMDDQRTLVVNPATQTKMVKALQGFYNPQATISDNFVNGLIAKKTLGFDWFTDQNIRMHTYGTCTTASVNGAQSTTQPTDNSTGYNLTVSAITGTLTAGTVLTIANVYAVNPQNRQSTGSLRQFVVTADVANGATTIPIFPAPVFSGAFQNCYSSTATIANSATVTPASASSNIHPQNLAFHRDAFTLAMVDLPLVGGTDMCHRESDDGISIRLVRDYNINSDQLPCRLDVMYGVAVLRPELACRITG